MKNFEVAQLHVAKEMMRLGGRCIGCHLDYRMFTIFEFERTEEVKALYEQARRNLGKIK